MNDEREPVRISDLPTHRTILAVDVVAFTRSDRGNLGQLAIRRALYAALQKSFNVAGVVWADCVCEDRGDGALIFIPADFPKVLLLDLMFNVLAEQIKAHNHVAQSTRKFRLRAALHAGEVHQDSYGFAGFDVNFACRMLDASALRRTMESTDNEVGVIVSELIYNGVVRHGYGQIDPAAYRKVEFRVKGTRAKAWVRVVGDMNQRTLPAPSIKTAPEKATTLTELTEQIKLLRMRTMHGRQIRLSVDLLYERSAPPVTRSTFAKYLSGRILAPREVFLNIVRACGVDDPVELDHWSTGWSQTALGHVQTLAKRTASTATAQVASSQVPRQLGQVPTLIDQVAAISDLDRLVSEPDADTTRIAVISGAPGVGKTTLALHWARRVADRFPDGQLYVDMHGYSPAPPADPADAIETFLASFGVYGLQLPEKFDARLGLYRSLLARRRVIIVLDNVKSAAHVRLLLPGGRHCVTLITSRLELPGLVALQGARLIRLKPLIPQDSVSLLCQVLGRDVSGDKASGDLADRCGHLPLALRIAAAQISSSELSISNYQQQLTMNGLAMWENPDDKEAAVRDTFDLSYQQLPPDAATLLRRAGLVPAPDFTSSAAAALIGQPEAEAERLLGILVSHNLIEQRVPGRYQCHDLLRLYAQDRAQRDDSAIERNLAEHRLFEWYLRSSDRAIDRIFPSMPRLPRPTSDEAVQPMVFAGSDDAREWLATERAGLIAVAKRTLEHADPPAVRAIANTLCAVFWIRFHGMNWTDVAATALDSVGEDEDHYVRATMHLAMGAASWGAGHVGEAAEQYSQALRLVQDDDAAVRALAHIQLGVAYRFLGRRRAALSQIGQALMLRRQLGDIFGQASALAHLCALSTELAELDKAREYASEVLILTESIDYSAAESMALDTFGRVSLETGRLAAAIVYFGQSLARRTTGGDRLGQPDTRVGLASAYLEQGRRTSELSHFDQARAEAEEALTVAREVGDRVPEINALNMLGSVNCYVGKIDGALRSHQEALRLAVQVSSDYGAVHAHVGLAESYLRANALDLASEHAEVALNEARANNQRLVEGRIHGISARISNVAGHPDVARERWGRALAIFQETGQLLAETEALSALALLHIEGGEPDTAAAYERQLRELQDRLNAEDD